MNIFLCVCVCVSVCVCVCVCAGMCPHLRSILVEVSASDYFEEPDTEEARHLFGEILSTLKVSLLKTSTGNHSNMWNIVTSSLFFSSSSGSSAASWTVWGPACQSWRILLTWTHTHTHCVLLYLWGRVIPQTEAVETHHCLKPFKKCITQLLLLFNVSLTPFLQNTYIFVALFKEDLLPDLKPLISLNQTSTSDSNFNYN